MADTQAGHEPRNRHACESCRRRKAKCTAERPVCSICQRTGQQCMYLPRDQTKRLSKIKKSPRKVSSDRIQHIESQISDLYAILQSNTRVDTELSPRTAITSADRRPEASGVRETLRSEYSDATIQHAIQVYKTNIHLQPLPLFNLQSLPERLATSSQFLGWSLLALCSAFSSTESSSSGDPNAATYYSRLAYEAVMELACEGTYTLEVLQSLCLLALSDMIGCKPARAWMTIGMAARLQAFRNLRPEEPLDDTHLDAEHCSRCYWSIFILERAFSCQLKASGREENQPKYPPSPSWLAPQSVRPRNAQVSEDIIGEQRRKDPGISTQCIKLVSIWGDITSYLHNLRAGKTEKPWLPNSTNAQLTLQLYECEARTSSLHLLRNARLSDRSATEMLEHQEYWTLWAFQQVSFHTVSAILNHPFIHLVTPGDNNRAPQPRFFLQKTVDLALFHAGWVVRLLWLLDNFPFNINDPLIGHLVAATATILWFFQFVRDGKTSHKAKEDLEKCQSFLSKISRSWPHISQKLQLLRHLPAEVQNNATEDESTTITFRPSVIWTLLDSTVPSMETSDREASSSQNEQGEDASIRLTVNFVPPLVDGPEHPFSSKEFPVNDLYSAASGGFDPMLHGFFSQFTSNDGNDWLSAMQPADPGDGTLI